ncbi:MAG: hypothetical protein KDI15_04470 [Thiothrix sp.]|nr:hypothetical protein [Thiothrix sp.]HPE58963.1 proton-conducting transporter membrane subunit [Thiolinea sp.]
MIPVNSWLDLMIALALGLPLLAAGWTGLGMLLDWNRGETGEAETALAATLSASLSVLLLGMAGLYSLFVDTPGTRTWFVWLASGDKVLTFSLLLDGLSLSLGFVLNLIILLVIRFSVNYLHREPAFQRFFLLMGLFQTAMLLIILSGNLLVAFIGWELAGLCSFLLIAYDRERDTATANATYAFLSNRIGDAGFLIALYTALAFLGTAQWEPLFLRAQNEPSLVPGIVLLGLIGAAWVKSAQFPFCGWITRAIEGPTPSSAVFYSAVMVHAGVYLMLRAAPLLEQVPLINGLLLLAGGLTLVYAWLCAQVQTDIKSSLIHATLMQVALMMLWIGLGWYRLAAIHLALHACWRAYQFLHAPAFMQLVQGAAPAAAPWLQHHPGLYRAALLRFWLDPLAEWFLIQPTRKLAREAELFEEQVVERVVGIPALEHGDPRQLSDAGIGSGLGGRLMQSLASLFALFEDKLVLNNGGTGLSGLIDTVGRRFEQIETFLSQPRYLVLMVAITLVIIL